ncbi:MAG: gliding motility-associated ABC transporter ATP-binding subunit GldA [Chitinophagales bacterium]|nr:gliding motility-associated ABC transporter ATP-binding subunit GldA [Chitinophagales bacterium]
MSVVVNGLSKVYGVQRAVDNISFSVENGQILGFLGPNGAGKSTTMKMLACFIPPTSGTALVNGFDILQKSIEVRNSIGYLPENNPLYYDMYVREYLEFAARAFGLKKNIDRKIDDLIGLIGITPEKHKKIGTLSKGYKQRIGLAQALINDPKVLILDEPTSGLDPNQLVDIRQLIRDLGKEKIIIFSTHIMQEVQAVCDRVIIINKGKLVADDSMEQLKNKTLGQAQIEIEFLHPVEIIDIQQLEGVSSVVHVSGNLYRIEGGDGIELRKKLAWFVSEKSNAVTLMKEIDRSLEDIFHNLTQR